MKNLRETKVIISLFYTTLLLLFTLACNGGGTEFSTQGKKFLLGENDNVPPVTEVEIVEDAEAPGPTEAFVSEGDTEDDDTDNPAGKDETDDAALNGRAICLWPPNHKMVEIDFTELAAEGGAVESVTSSQPDQMPGIESDRIDDVASVEGKPTARSFRSERWFEPRIYTVKLQNDEKPFYVIVPHDMSPKHLVKAGDMEVNCHVIIKGAKKIGKESANSNGSVHGQGSDDGKGKKAEGKGDIE